ncbi:hypothetical protein Tco_0189344 [Tanacetum coccineum]
MAPLPGRGPFNGGNCRRCTNVCFGDDFVRNPDPISNDETPDFSYPPPQPQTSSLNQFHCFHYKDPLEEGKRCQWCTCKWCGYGLREGSCWICPSRDENSSIDAPNSFNDLTNVFTHPPQPQYETYLCELCGNDSHYVFHRSSRDLNQQRISDVHVRWDKIEESQNELLNMMQSFCEVVIQQKQAANIDQSPPQEMSIQEMEDLKQQYLDEMLRNEDLSTIPEKESDEFIKSSVEDLVPIPSESEDTSGSDSDCDLPSCDDFSPINGSEDKSVTFSNPLFDSNDDFTFSDNESLSDKDVLEDTIKIYSNPLFEFDDKYISSDVNPLFDEVLENIERGEINEINVFLDIDVSTDIEDGYHDSEGDIIYLESLLFYNTIPNLPPEVFLDHDPKNLKDGPDNEDLKRMNKDCPDFENSCARGFVHRSLS